MRTPRVAFISMIVLTVAVAACSERSGVAADMPGSQSVWRRRPAARPPARRSKHASRTRPTSARRSPARRARARSNRTSRSMSSCSRRGSRTRGPWSRCPAATCSSPRSRAACASSRRRASWAQPIAGVPAVDARGQGGLLDVALSPTFDRRPDDLLELHRAATGRQRDQRRARRAVGRPAAPRAGARDLPRAADLRRRQALRLAARLRPGRHAVRHARRALGRADAAAGAAARQPHGQDPAHHARRLGPDRQPVRRAARRAARDLDARPSQRAGRRVRSAGTALGGRAWHARAATS